MTEIDRRASARQRVCRVLICGSRTWSNRAAIEREVDLLLSKYAPNEIVVIEGEARGADSLARAVAHERGLMVMPFPADWQRYGRGAGPIRNKQMLDEGQPTLVIAFSEDISTSKGTANMVRQAEKAGVKTKVVSE
jgi:hypothetical protein